MPKIKGYTPAWLSPPSVGHGIFAPAPDDPSIGSVASTSKAMARSGPRRTIAHRGTEVFIAVGKEIRWADLVYLKERWQEKASRGGAGVHIKREDSDTLRDEDIIRESIESGFAEGFRTIKTNIGSDIQQLVISPFANFMAVVTTHTVRIILIPDPAHLTAPTIEAIKPKSWTLGPTTHVVDRSPIASALWHPLGVNGSALVTVTRDAVVRVWELSQTNRWSFDDASLTIDLQKLADGVSLDQDFSVKPSTKKGFTPDSFEMEVAAACFAGRGSGGWSPMTLWVAMREGDVYALCPLLPSLWAPPPTLIPSLSISIVGNLAAIEDDQDVSEAAKLLAQQQLDWMSDLDNQEPKVIDGPSGEPPTEVYVRPTRPGVVPRLQGPFELEMSPETDIDLDVELADIFAIGEKLDTDDLMMGEDEELEIEEIERGGLSLSVICLLASSGQLRICLDLDGVQAQWLPPKNKSRSIGPLASAVGVPSLLTFQALDLLGAMDDAENGWPMFSPDVTSRYSFYVTHSSSITFVSLPWVFRLENELSSDTEAGSEFRIDLLVSGQNSIRERLYANQNQELPLSASVAIQDPDLGYFLLSATPFEPVTVVFDTSDDDLQPIRSASPAFEKTIDAQPLDFFEPRPTYVAPHVFVENSTLPALVDKLRSSRLRTMFQSELKLSPAALQIFTEAHQILSDETHKISVAAADLFRRCDKLQSELKQQIVKANEVKARVDGVTGEDLDTGGNPESNSAMIERRLQNAREKGAMLNQRLEKMRKTVSKATMRELSDKERSWMHEVNTLSGGILESAPATEGPARLKQTLQRYEDAKQLRDELVQQAQRLESAPLEEEESLGTAAADLRIPSELRRAKISQVRGLLERETALVEAVKSRLERLSMTT